MSCRRQFLKAAPLVFVASAVGITSKTAWAALLDEQDPAARKLGYVADGATVDEAKFPQHKGTQRCANCQLYQGDSASTSGGCVLFGDKKVAAKGWCSAWEQG